MKTRLRSDKEYVRKYQMLRYYQAKKVKTENDLAMIEKLQREFNLISDKIKTETKINKISVKLNRIKASFENGSMTKNDVEDSLILLEMERKTENTKICIIIFLDNREGGIMVELGENVWNLEKYEFRALRYAEHYGIADYEVKGNIMEYTEKFNNEGVFVHKVDLDEMKELY